MKKIAVVFGTRPDTIKMAPIIAELKQHPSHFQVLSIATAQHRQMLDQVLNVFDIKPDYDLNIMEPKQSLARITRNIIDALDEVLAREKPDIMLVQGDTTTTFVGSLAAFYRNVPIGHIEAGLRTNDKFNPFPEEINRRLTSVVTDLHFAPTETAKKALLRERIDPATVFVTGNTVIDALRLALKKEHTYTVPVLNELAARKGRMVLLTMHRRENWGDDMKNACSAVRTLALRYPDINFVFPVHLNPIVREVVFEILRELKNVFLIEPLDYLDFINIMKRSTLIITDSGGVQEEAPALGKPVLVLRKVTERPEAVKYGTVKLVGVSEQKITRAAIQLLDDPKAYKAMATAVNPYGDGLSSKRTVAILKNYFGISRTTVKEFIPR